MSEMTMNPRILQKAQADLRDELQGKPTVTDDGLPGLNYMKLVFKETPRLHPPAPMLTRECDEQCKVLSYDVPKGANVLVNGWAISRDPKRWDDAETFTPERFKDGAVDFTGADTEFLPFGPGPRMCPGVAFTQAVVELALAAMLYHFFDWELPAGVDMVETGVVVRRKNDLYLPSGVPLCATGRATAPAI
jgi:cytochrome P450